MRGFFRDFRFFVARGNVLDLAVAVVIGAAFGGVTTSLVNDVLMPPLGDLVGGVDFQALVLRLNGDVVIRYGAFLDTVVNFVIALFAMFLVVRGVARCRTCAAERRRLKRRRKRCRSRSPYSPKARPVGRREVSRPA